MKEENDDRRFFLSSPSTKRSGVKGDMRETRNEFCRTQKNQIHVRQNIKKAFPECRVQRNAVELNELASSTERSGVKRACEFNRTPFFY